MSQYGRPSSTISGAGWSANGGPSELWDCVNETPYSDTDYCRGTGAVTMELKLSSVSDPFLSSGHVVNWRGKSNGSGAAEKWTVTLYQGSTLIATLTNATTISRSWTNYTYTLTTAQADAITDYSDLRIRIALTTIGGSETVDVSFEEMVFPDVASLNGVLDKSLDALSLNATGVLESDVTEYYVAPWGNNSYPGTFELPWQTVDYGVQHIMAGDTLIVRGGIYREYVILTVSGTSGNPITIKGYTGETAKICGADILMSWTNHAGNVWKATIANNPHVVMFNGTVGNEKSALVDVDSEFDYYWEATVLYVYSAGGDPSTVYTDPGVEAGIRSRGIYCGGAPNINYITFQDLTIYGVGSNYGSAIECTNNTGWNFSYVTIEKCGAIGIMAGGCSYHNIISCTFTGIRTLYSPDYGESGINYYQIDTTVPHHIWVDHSNVTNWTNYGVSIWGQNYSNRSYNNEVSDNDLSHNATGCYFIKVRDSIIHDNTCDDNLKGSAPLSEEYGLAFETVSDCEVYRNTCTNGRVGMEIWAWTGVEWPDSGPSDNNKVHHNIFSGNAHQGFLIYTGNADNTQLYTNKMYDNGYGGINLFDANVGYESTGCTCYNNTLYNNDLTDGGYGDIYCGHTLAGWTFRNNIFSQSNRPCMRYGVTSSSVHDHNLYYRPTGTVIDNAGTTYDLAHVTDWETTAIAADPKFVDPGADNFHLQSDSPCFNAGVDVGLTVDYDYNPIIGNPDIGAYEIIYTTGFLEQTLGVLGIDATGTITDASGISGVLNQSLAGLEISSQGKVDISGVLSKTLGSLGLSSAGKVEINGVLSKTLGNLGLLATGKKDVAGVLDKTLGDLGLSSSGKVDIKGVLSQTLGVLGLNSAGKVDIKGNADIALSALTLQATGTLGEVGINGQLNVVLGVLILVATGGFQIAGTIDISDEQKCKVFVDDHQKYQIDICDHKFVEIELGV